ncbi:MAG: [FeFe] hydrogenase H-cluster radical SAM maturase HydG [Rikenellaceae bacterium]
MNFTPQQYSLPDRVGEIFIDPQEIRDLLGVAPSDTQIDQVVALSLGKKRLSMGEVALLLNADPLQRERVMAAARELKQLVYGNRIVLFAPLYVGNLCSNGCTYCTFRSDNLQAIRKTLSSEELRLEVEALEDAGHKRLVLVYGEHPRYDAEFIAQSVSQTYSVRKGNGEIRRVNINAAPLSVEGFERVARSGIGTYQIFQESYDPELYSRFHPFGAKSNYAWRLMAFDRAMQGGIDDVGIGALFGLGDWRFEVMAMVRHTNHLETCFGVGPHTISFPRITAALGADSAEMPISDDDFIYLISVLRLAVPYAGLILTAREPSKIRDRAIAYGVSQIDGGTKLDIGSYSGSRERGSRQFTINDDRALSDVVGSLVSEGRIPSFCTACYRKGRTGEHFMEFSTTGFIKRFCTPNAILSFAEYLEDYSDAEGRAEGYRLISGEMANCGDNQALVLERLTRIKAGERDLFF